MVEESRKVCVASGVALGLNAFFIVLWGNAGEKGVVRGGLSLISDDRKILRAVAMEPLLRLAEGSSSRGARSFRAEPRCGVPRRFDANGELFKWRVANPS